MVVEVRDARKSFFVPEDRQDSLKERVLHPMSHRNVHPFHALKGVSFDIRKGEFFGIVGRNGSGKSTLLKIMASIYAADAGTIRVRGRIAPFIELGVGFNPDLTARENVTLNGVMMGLSRRDAANRLDEVLEFAELEEFAELKLKNYSSGMLVRLAFSVMILSEADILLIDEILAVGDAAFQQKCADVFKEMRRSGRTVVLVTHDMGAVEGYCHRAMLLEDGEMVAIGKPGEIGRHYLRLNFERPEMQAVSTLEGRSSEDVELVEIWTENAGGEHETSIEEGEDIRLVAIVEAKREIPGANFGFVIHNADGLVVFATATPLPEDGKSGTGMAPGQRVQVTSRIENRLSTGRYHVDFAVHRNSNHLDNALWVAKALDFVIFGGTALSGLVRLDSRTEAKVLDAPGGDRSSHSQ